MGIMTAGTMIVCDAANRGSPKEELTESLRGSGQL
jgi:hypothetical protein